MDIFCRNCGAKRMGEANFCTECGERLELSHPSKTLNKTNRLTEMKIVKRWNNISPALVLYFDNHRPMPIRDYKWDEYLQFYTESKDK